MAVIVEWAVFDAAHPAVDIQVGFAEFDARGAVVDVTVGFAEFDTQGVITDVTVGWAEFDTREPPAQIYGGGGVVSRYHDEDAPKQYRIRVHAENDEEEQIILNLIMEFARHVL
jgi:hypothetical protein